MNKSFSTVVYNNKFTMHSHLISFIIKIISSLLYLNVKVIIRNHFLHPALLFCYRPILYLVLSYDYLQLK